MTYNRKGKIERNMDKVGKNPKLKPLVWLFLRWYNEILVFCRAVAVSLDPLFFYVPVIKEDKKCVELNKVLWIIAIVSRSVADFIYLVHSVVKSKILNKSTPAKRRKSLYFWSIFMLNILVILPIPQSAAVKGGSNKGKEPVIDVDDPSPRPKRTRSLSGVYIPTNSDLMLYFRVTTPLVERAIDQTSLHETNILIWFATKDWNFLLADLDVAYVNMVREFYANAIIEGDELKCWVRGKSFSVSPVCLADILYINQPMLAITPIYDDLNPDEDLLRATLGRNLEFFQTGNSISVSSLSPELRVLTIIMFHNLYPLSSSGYMNLGRALFLHDLISDKEIDISAYIFHLLCKTVLRIDSRACIPFCCLISRILKLKGIHPSDNESPYPKQSPINIRTFNASIGHSRKGIKTESSAPPIGSHFTSSSYDEKLDNIMVSIQDISTKMSKPATFLHHHHIRCDTKSTSLQTQ